MWRQISDRRQIDLEKENIMASTASRVLTTAMIAMAIAIAAAGVLVLQSPAASAQAECGPAEFDYKGAAEAVLTGDFELIEDPQRANDYAVVPDDVGNRYSLDATKSIAFCFNVESPGTFILEPKVFGPDDNSNSFWVQVDDGTPEVWHFEPDTRDAFEFKPVTGLVYARDSLIPTHYELGAGDHSIKFIQREDGSHLEGVRLERIGHDALGPESPPCVSFDELQEAEDGMIKGLFVTTSVGDQTQLTSNLAATDSFPLAFDRTTSATYCISVTEPGDYRLVGTTTALSNTGDSFTVLIEDSDGSSTFDWHLKLGYDVVNETHRTWSLEPGDHVVRLFKRERLSTIDSFRFVKVGADK